VPEVGGPIDPHNEAHDLIMSVFGGVSKGERNRVRIRVRTAMAAQAQHEGRFLGGRPPYGYQLADAGPHPHPGKAADGRQLHVLATDEPAAAVIRQIFADYLAGYSLGAIADRLNRGQVPCPSAHDPRRNPHRSGARWMKSTIRTILRNPRYTGRQVWNRQRKDEVLIDVNDVALGHTTKMRWNDPGEWVYSDAIAHPALVGDGDFDAAQDLLSGPRGRAVTRKPRSTSHPYLLRGLLICGTCGRRMQGSWSNNQAYYRCRPSGRSPEVGATIDRHSVCRSEKELVDAWLASQRERDQSGGASSVGAPGPHAAGPVEFKRDDRPDRYSRQGLRVTVGPGRMPHIELMNEPFTDAGATWSSV